jgi:hypothetical protein
VSKKEKHHSGGRAREDHSLGKSWIDLISTHKPGVVVLTCDPNFMGGIGRRIVIQGNPRAKM